MHRTSTSSLFATSPRLKDDPRFNSRREHGGALVRRGPGGRKIHRPVDPRRPLHVVLRSERAKGDWSLLTTKNERQVKHLVHWCARRFGVKVYRFANAGNHIHLVAYAKKREFHSDFLRTLSAMIARRVTGAKKGYPVGKFWDGLFWSRIVNWGNDLENAIGYVILNEAEALGWGFGRRRGGMARARSRPG